MPGRASSSTDRRENLALGFRLRNLHVLAAHSPRQRSRFVMLWGPAGKDSICIPGLPAAGVLRIVYPSLFHVNAG
jgi:hypothetical protein